MSNKFYDIAFTPNVKVAQIEYGSRRIYERSEGVATEQNATLSESEIEFIGERDGFYMATIGENDYPYVQFRGGQRGFLKVLDEKTLGFADFRGNLQYITVGNVRANKKVALFLMDYANRRRLKILAEVEVSDAAGVPELIERLKVPDYKAEVERAIILHVEAFDWNCPQHITPRYTIEEMQQMIEPLNEYVLRLEREIAELKKEKI